MNRLKALVLGLTLSGKDQLISNVSRYYGVKDHAVPLHGVVRTAAPVRHTINLDEWWNTPGLADIQLLDDRTVRIFTSEADFDHFDVIVYCWRPTGRQSTGIRYCQMFGDNTPVTLVINHYPADDQKAAVEQEARRQVEAQGLVVGDVFYLPPPPLIHTTPDLANLLNRLRQFTGGNGTIAANIRFTPAPLSEAAQQIIRLKRLRAADLQNIVPLEVNVFCSQGMDNGQERDFVYPCPDSRHIVSWRIDEYSVNDEDPNGWSRMEKVSSNAVRIHARMPNAKRCGFLDLDRKNQWRDANYYITHAGTANASIQAQLDTLKRAGHVALFTEIESNWTYYDNKCPA